MLFIKVNRYRLEKAKKSPHLVPEKRSITRAGKTFMMTVWVDPTDKKKGKGKRSPVEDKTPSQMSLFDMGDLSGKPRKKETQKPKTKLGAFEYKLDGTTLMYKNPNADWKQLAFLSSPEKALEYQKLVEAHDKAGGQGSARSIVDPDLQRMVSTIQAEKEADGYFATNPKGETEAEERAMAGYEVNGAKKQSKPEGKKTVEDDDRYNMTNKAWKVLNRAGEALEKNGKTYMKDKKLKEYREVKVSPDRMEVKNIYKERMDRVLNKLAAGELKSGDDLQKLSEQKEELEFVQNNLSNYKKKIKEIEDRGNLSVNLNELIMYMDFEDDALRRLEKVNEVSGPLLEKIEKEGMKKSIFSFAKNWIQGNR